MNINMYMHPPTLKYTVIKQTFADASKITVEGV